MNRARSPAKQARWLLLVLAPPVVVTAAVVVLGAGSTALHIAATGDAAYVVLVVLARLRRTWPPAADAPVREARFTPPAASVPALERTESVLLFSQTSRVDYERYLRPTLFALALSRLRRRGVDAMEQPEQTERLLGRPVWELIRPPDQRPDRDVPGVPLEKIESVVTALEEVKRWR